MKMLETVYQTVDQESTKTIDKKGCIGCDYIKSIIDFGDRCSNLSRPQQLRPDGTPFDRDWRPLAHPYQKGCKRRTVTGVPAPYCEAPTWAKEWGAADDGHKCDGKTRAQIIDAIVTGQQLTDWQAQSIIDASREHLSASRIHWTRLPKAAVKLVQAQELEQATADFFAGE